MTRVRAATPADSAAVARVHVRSWQSAYRGLIAQDYLDGLEPDRWANKYAFDRVGVGLPSTLVAVRDDSVCGLAVTGLCRDQDLPGFGELLAIYVDPDHLRSGVGQVLITAARQRLRGLGVPGAALWVLDGNVRARRFYQRDGWQPDGARRTETFGHQTVEEVRYRRPSV